MSKLYLVPTPIGNLEDLTFRAKRILSEVDLILAEDTRKTSFLLKHYHITKPLRAYHKFNEHKNLAQFLELIQSGKTVALVTDAGTPGISDPGFLLVRECARNQIEVECLPGPTALIPALANSGLSSDKFVFEGFLPQKKGRQKRLTELKDESRTIIFYESPYRIIKLLNELRTIFGAERQVSVSREISKIHEETLRGNLDELINHFNEKPPKGEFVVVVGSLKNNTPED